MEVFLILVAGILVLAYLLRWLSSHFDDGPAVSIGAATASQTKDRNPYIVSPIERSIFPILDDPRTPERIEECARSLHTARQRLAMEFGRQALVSDGVGEGHGRKFRRAWKTVCDVAEAKYGDVILRKALRVAGYREPDPFEFKM